MKDTTKRIALRDVPDSWRCLLNHPQLRPIFLNRLALGGLFMATEPLLAVLMLRDLHFAPWQYGLAFAVPCIGGFVGSRLAGPTVAKYGEHKVMRIAGVGAVLWPIWPAFTPTLGLVRPWGEIAPRWLPLIGGRRPALLGAAMLCTTVGWFAFSQAASLIGRVAQTTAQQVVPVVCYAPLLAWPPLLVATTVAYYRRRKSGLALLAQ
ncbi:MFS transporter [Amycolatopsis rhizosphaerae]|uniref:MFS transporter n=1 Tax=Amycolatopsis rhizosphaerae TaxID=2053003 RepID=A0A558CCD0_9PSEU|nr:MFS transporter [Amycolatopsis rhizosphaerae]TVT46420.1 MFS transporter [Amycolatopsis rhizosphaerae]